MAQFSFISLNSMVSGLSPNTLLAPGKSDGCLLSLAYVITSISQPRVEAILHNCTASCSPPIITSLKAGCNTCEKI